MRNRLAAGIARRYLYKETTRGAVGTISTVSVCAMAVATAAIVCVLSVFNGFREVIGARLDTLSPDVMVTPAEGKVFAQADSVCRAVLSVSGVAAATPTLSDNALVIGNSQEMPVTIKGVRPDEYSRITAVKSLIGDDYGQWIGDAGAEHDYMASADIAIGIGMRLRVYPDDHLLIFAPKREGRVNMANPAASFITDSLHVAGIYRTDQQQFDADGIIAPLDVVRELLQYDTEASAIEVKATEATDPARLAADISKKLGSRFIVRDRLRQQETNFRMISIEKWVSFLLLGFILLIASFNCISSLSMVVIQKQKAIGTLVALGASRRDIGRIFAWESIYVSLAGGLAGLLLGVVLCLLQQHFGLIKLGGDPSARLIAAYPVRLEWSDLLLTLVPVGAIGLLTAWITSRFARSRIGAK
ncbi:MAG: ABC transporter permease [Muribaculaceae bacterium]|nr:ABC transporter permease [Muribaculaceae bacterium]